MDKKIYLYDRNIEVFKLPGDEHMLLIPVASDDNISHEVVGPFLSWNVDTGIIETRDAFYKPKEKDAKS